jgi:hypothetical protein
MNCGGGATISSFSKEDDREVQAFIPAMEQMGFKWMGWTNYGETWRRTDGTVVEVWEVSPEEMYAAAWASVTEVTVFVKNALHPDIRCEALPSGHVNGVVPRRPIFRDCAQPLDASLPRSHHLVDFPQSTGGPGMP